VTTPSTMAASTLCRRVLSGPRIALSTAYRGRDSWLLTSAEPRLGVSLLTPRAVLLPRSLVVPALPPGSPQLSIGDGALWYDDRRVAVRRWFTPPRVVRGALREHPASPAPPGGLVAGWCAHLGEGDGLTPYGDDVICGIMLGLLATDHEDADRLAQEIRETDLDARTTALSAALLRCACEGWCIPEVERLLVALAENAPADHAVRRLLAVGHSSGRGLLAGLASVLDLAQLGMAA
jgi:Protein of unknown function (DUF2877)